MPFIADTGSELAIVLPFATWFALLHVGTMPNTLANLLRTLVLMSAACSIGARPVYAECVRFGPSASNWPGVDVVFDGTVVALRQNGEMQVAQMQVHRVFKGQLPPQIEMYHRPNIEVSGIEVAQRYVLPLVRANPSGTGIIPHRPFLEPRDDRSTRVDDDRVRRGAPRQLAARRNARRVRSGLASCALNLVNRFPHLERSGSAAPRDHAVGRSKGRPHRARDLPPVPAWPRVGHVLAIRVGRNAP
ncbi:MAG: hypothetical protein AB7H81_25600 [Vicinamibacterales bacterium]